LLPPASRRRYPGCRGSRRSVSLHARALCISESDFASIAKFALCFRFASRWQPSYPHLYLKRPNPRPPSTPGDSHLQRAPSESWPGRASIVGQGVYTYGIYIHIYTVYIYIRDSCSEHRPSRGPGALQSSQRSTRGGCPTLQAGFPALIETFNEESAERVEAAEASNPSRARRTPPAV
jgi:hypothetical protein